MREKSVIRPKVGPFLINNKTIREEKEMAEILSKQYENICSKSRESIDLSDLMEFLRDNGDISGTCNYALYE